MGIYSFKPKFIGQLLSKRIPYQVYTAYITVDDNENMYASKVLHNTIGAVTFKKEATGFWFIQLPYVVPRLNIMIPGSSDYWNHGTAIYNSNNNISRDMNTYPGYGVNGDFSVDTENGLTDRVEVAIQEEKVGGIPWRTFFGGNPTGYTTSYPIEIRVYN